MRVKRYAQLPRSEALEPGDKKLLESRIADWKSTSQANHLSKLIELKKEAERQAHHMQRLYKRRKLINNEGSIKSNWSTLMETSTFDG